MKTLLKINLIIKTNGFILEILGANVKQFLMDGLSGDVSCQVGKNTVTLAIGRLNK